MVSVGDTLPFPKEADFLASHSSYEDLLRLNTHRTISAPGRCVVVATARNSASTSDVFCRNIDNSGRGEGNPFQLRKSENKSFWTNEEVTNEGIKFGCLLEYRVVTCRLSFLGRYCDLGEQDGKQFIFHKRTSKLQDVDKILLDLQDDESVHEGLKEALECYSPKDADRGRILQEFMHLIFVDYGRLLEALKCFNSKHLDKILLDLTNCISAHYNHLKVALKFFNPEYERTIQLDFINLTFAHFERLSEALRCLIPKHLDKIPLDLTNCIIIAHYNHLKEALRCFNPEYERTIQLDFINLTFAHFERLKEALRCLIPKFQELQAYSACTRIFFIGIRAGTINNERVTLTTMNGEWLGMPLNCRENLVLSTRPVHLQLKRSWDVADDDVGGVAVVKFEAGEATCEGLILKYKPYVISRDEEPVKIQNSSGEMIPIHHVFELEPGKIRWKVLFDTGNEVGTGISRELLEELKLQADPEKKKKVELIGGESREFETTQIKLVVRGHHLSACGLVDAVAKDTNLLVGMDVIQQLYDKGYTIGN